MLNTRTLAVIVGALSLLLGLWAVIDDTAAMGMAAGALGFVAGLMSLLPADPETIAADPPAAADVRTPPDAAPTPAVDLAVGETPTASVTDEGGDDAGITPAAGLTGAALTDTETDLFSEGYLKVALDSRLASARRHLRPVAVAVLEVTEGMPDTNAGSAIPTTVANAINDTLRDSDIACRLNNGTFAIILEDTPENGAVWTVERIRRNLVSTSGHHTMWAGVACYPAHAFDGPELLNAVLQALDSAKAWNQDRIEVAVAE